MRLAAACLMLALGTAGAAGVQVQVQPRPGLTFNREVPSVVTLHTPWGTQTGRLDRGRVYPGDPQHYWGRLDPVTFTVTPPATARAGRFPVSVQTELYVCDQLKHVCSVRAVEVKGMLDTAPDAEPLILMLKVPGLKTF